MLEIPFARYTPFQHQQVGVATLIEKPTFALFDEMGAGKTKQIIDAAQLLHDQGVIDCVVVIAPNAVKSVWFDKEWGQLAAHLWLSKASRVIEFHSRCHAWDHGKVDDSSLIWIITNYDFIRNDTHREEIERFCDKKTWLVLDESSAVKNYRAKQTKACLKLRRKCGRVTLLNGTPIVNNPMDMYSQGNMMDPKILECPTIFQFRARYAVMGGFNQKEVIKWVNLDDLQRRFAPYVLRRLKSQCLDLPEKLPSIVLIVPLEENTWAVYKQMRDDMVAWLSTSTLSVARQAIVKVLRLAQVTSGFIGGIEESEPDLNRPSWLPFPEATPEAIPQEIGREKLDIFSEWFDAQLGSNPTMKLLVWCRFRLELHRLYETLQAKYPELSLGVISGGQKPEDRNYALQLLDPRTMPRGPVVVIGTPSSGSMGLNLTGAHTVVYLSNDCNLKTRLQSEDRVHRPGQQSPVSYFDVVAVGPKGQRTIDHIILKALRDKSDLASWTTAAWIAELTS